MGQQIGKPGRVVDIALAAGDGPDMQGVGEDEFHTALEHMPHGFPVHAGGFHRNMGTAVRGEPIAQREQLRGRRAERPHVVGDGCAAPGAGARHDRQLMDVEGGWQRMEAVKFNRLLLPGATVRLTLRSRDARRQIQFSYSIDGSVCSSGRLVAHG